MKVSYEIGDPDEVHVVTEVNAGYIKTDLLPKKLTAAVWFKKVNVKRKKFDTNLVNTLLEKTKGVSVVQVEKQESIPNDRAIEKSEELAVFFGFTGPLQNCYAFIRNFQELQELRSVIELQSAGKEDGFSIPVISYEKEKMLEKIESLKGQVEFEKIESYQIPYKIRYYEKQKLLPIYEFATENEFDDECIESCSAGDHHCGKESRSVPSG